MIIWLASYPKSGNTWLRSFLTSLLYSADGINDFSNLKKIDQFPNEPFFKNFVNNTQDIEEIYKNWKNVQDFINLDNELKILKTHHLNCVINNFKFTDNSNTIGVIHIVRDPRNITVSLKNHFSLNNFVDAKEMIIDDNRWLGFNKSEKFKDQGNKVPTLIGSWQKNYLSWKNKSKNYLLIKYEDLLKDPLKEFLKVTKYIENLMNIKFDENKMLNSIRTTSFDNLQKLEKKGLFKEYKQEINFFHQGPKNDWKLHLNNEIVNEINIKFKDEMQELGYY